MDFFPSISEFASMAAKLSQILLLYLVQMNAIDDEEEELVVEEVQC